MGKTRDTKGTFHAKMGTIKDRNGMNLTEAEDIKKRWQDYTKLYKKDLHKPDNHDGVITMNKASGGDGFSVELFQMLKDDVAEVLHSNGYKIGRAHV